MIKKYKRLRDEALDVQYKIMFELYMQENPKMSDRERRFRKAEFDREKRAILERKVSAA